MNSGWAGVISLLIVEIPLKCVTVLVWAPRHPFRALSRFWPRFQVDTYVYSVLLVRTWKNKGAGSWGSLFLSSSSHLPWQLFIALSLVYVPLETILWTPSTGLSPPIPACCYRLRVLSKLEKGGPHYIALLASVWHSFWCLRLPLDISRLVYQRVRHC